MSDFDLHVATEICEFNNEIGRELEQMGLDHDPLLERRVDFYGDTLMSACPLIGLHMTKKYAYMSASEARDNVLADIAQVEVLLRKRNVIGYAHGELTNVGCDLTVLSSAPFSLCQRWPVERFEPRFNGESKQWDIHLAIPVDSFPKELERVLQSTGMYSIDLLKIRNGRSLRFRVFTIQGVSPQPQGKILFESMVNWLRAVNVPHAEIKLETYLAMIRNGNPGIVPPTITHFKLLASSEQMNIFAAYASLGEARS